MQERFKIRLNEEHVLELDSTTYQKFSRHLVFRIKRCSFKDNSHVNAFVQSLLERILEQDRSFFVKKGNSKQLLGNSSSATGIESHQDERLDPGYSPDMSLFIDNSVYTRNRAFRLYLSRKLGKTSVLLPTTRRGPFPIISLQGKQQEVDKELFFALLITNVDETPARLLMAYDEADPQQCRRFRGRIMQLQHRNPQAGIEQRSHSVPSHHYEPSPCPLLDEFIEKFCSQYRKEGPPVRTFIRSWAQVSPTQLIYNIQGHRFCGNVNREHRSNGVYYVVDVLSGSWYQRCYDRECSNYRSPSLPIPLAALQGQAREDESAERVGMRS